MNRHDDSSLNPRPTRRQRDGIDRQQVGAKSGERMFPKQRQTRLPSTGKRALFWYAEYRTRPTLPDSPDLPDLQYVQWGLDDPFERPASQEVVVVRGARGCARGSMRCTARYGCSSYPTLSRRRRCATRLSPSNAVPTTAGGTSGAPVGGAVRRTTPHPRSPHRERSPVAAPTPGHRRHTPEAPTGTSSPKSPHKNTPTTAPKSTPASTPS